MNFELPAIYPITDARLAGLSHAEQVERLIAGGATLIQLREKHGAPKDFYESAAQALKIARRHRAKIIVNDRVDIALALQADGVHLGQDDLPPKRAREILGARAIIGFSTHNPEQILDAIKQPIDYLAVGPIFPTPTKENPDPVVGVEFVKTARRIVGALPLVAIGGIRTSNLRGVLDAGADSAAMIGELLGDADQISRKLKSLLSQTENI